MSIAVRSALFRARSSAPMYGSRKCLAVHFGLRFDGGRPRVRPEAHAERERGGERERARARERFLHCAAPSRGGGATRVVGDDSEPLAGCPVTLCVLCSMHRMLVESHWQSVAGLPSRRVRGWKSRVSGRARSRGPTSLSSSPSSLSSGGAELS